MSCSTIEDILRLMITEKKILLLVVLAEINGVVIWKKWRSCCEDEDRLIWPL
jgi:hypothetical protein